MMALTPKHLEGFHGSNLGFLNYEILSIQNFTHKEVKMEPALMLSKWYDYRQLHYIQATYYFMKCYTNAYKDFVRTSIDSEKAVYVKAIKGHDFLDAREKSAFLRLRQLIDVCGMPYDFFLGRAMRLHYKMVGTKGVIYAPRPGHIACNEELVTKIMLAWEKQCEAYMNVAKSPFYKVKNFVGFPDLSRVGAPDQLAHEAWIIEQIKGRAHPKYALSTALYKTDTVRVEEALRQFDHHIISAAMTEHSSS